MRCPMRLETDRDCSMPKHIRSPLHRPLISRRKRPRSQRCMRRVEVACWRDFSIAKERLIRTFVADWQSGLPAPPRPPARTCFRPRSPQSGGFDAPLCLLIRVGSRCSLELFQATPDTPAWKDLVIGSSRTSSTVAH